MNSTVFVYGTLKAGYWNHRLLTGATFIGRAQSVLHYTMSDVGFPCIKPAREAEPGAGLVIGEVYRADDRALAAMDRLEANGSMYQRKEREFHVEGHDCPLEAWVYEWMGTHRGALVAPDKAGILVWDGMREQA